MSLATPRPPTWLLMVALLLAACTSLGLHASAHDDDPLGEQVAGAATVYTTGRNAFSFPLATLDDAERTRFVIGNSFFKRNWVQAPASTTARDGLGPLYIARACASCHVMDGRGAPPLGPDERTVALLLRLSVPGVPDPHLGVVPEPIYGDQFHNAAVPGVPPEGQVRISHTPVSGQFADGTPYTLQQPHYQLTQLGYGPLAADVRISPRIAPQLIGLGLLEAIAERDILANVRTQAALPGPIKGQANRVWDAYAQKTVLGRFGWKANTGSVAHQSAAAFNGDMGITSRVFWRENCTSAQSACLAAAHGGGAQPGTVLTAAQARPQAPEIEDAVLNQVIFYAATLAPVARREPADAQVLRGQALFHQAQCAACHRPSYVTGQPPFPHLSSPSVSGQRIWPYTDLLLHDMGPGLADGRPDFGAQGAQWKTPPLWGVGLIREVNGHQRLLHDGRADGVLDAILWHGGEAESSRQQVLRWSAEDRAALVRFVESL